MRQFGIDKGDAVEKPEHLEDIHMYIAPLQEVSVEEEAVVGRPPGGLGEVALLVGTQPRRAVLRGNPVVIALRCPPHLGSDSINILVTTQTCPL